MAKRKGLFPGRLSVSMSAATLIRLKTEGEKYDMSASILARHAIDAGLDKAIVDAKFRLTGRNCRS